MEGKTKKQIKLRNKKMRVKWENIFGLLLLIFAVYLFIKMRPFFNNLFEDVNQVHYYGYGPSMLLRVLMLGLVCLTAVAVAKIISRR
jgi:hypothetical protein